MGKKTSVWLGDDVVAAWHASRLPLAELVRRGLGMSDQEAGLEAPDVEAMVRRAVREIIREELSALSVAAGPQSGYGARYDEYEREPYLQDP